MTGGALRICSIGDTHRSRAEAVAWSRQRPGSAAGAVGLDGDNRLPGGESVGKPGRSWPRLMDKWLADDRGHSMNVRAFNDCDRVQSSARPGQSAASNARIIGESRHGGRACGSICHSPPIFIAGSSDARHHRRMRCAGAAHCFDNSSIDMSFTVEHQAGK